MDYSKCGYAFTLDNNEVGLDESKYKVGDLNEDNTVLEKAAPAGNIYLHILAVDKDGNKKEYISENCVTIEDTQNYQYTGTSQEINLLSGNYLFECWGAQGGGTGGKGAYTSGKINIPTDVKLYLYIGKQGNTYNGGGSSKSDDVKRYNGGGATDIRTISGAWNYENSLRSRIMVAGGGGRIWMENR